MLHRSRPNHRPLRRVAAAIAAGALALAACGGDDAAEVSPADSTTTTTATTTTTVGDSPTTVGESVTSTTSEAGSSGTIIVRSLDDIPRECQEVLADFLRRIEPTVEQIDWDTATLNDFEMLSDTVDEQFEDFDLAQDAAGCEAYDFGDSDASLDAAIEIAEQSAPGTVGWLEFLRSLTTDTAPAAGLPTDCDAAIAYIEDLVSDGSRMSDVPFSEVRDIGQVLNVIATECSEQQISDFYQRQDISDFLG